MYKPHNNMHNNAQPSPAIIKICNQLQSTQSFQVRSKTGETSRAMRGHAQFKQSPFTPSPLCNITYIHICIIIYILVQLNLGEVSSAVLIMQCFPQILPILSLHATVPQDDVWVSLFSHATPALRFGLPHEYVVGILVVGHNCSCGGSIRRR